MTSDQLDDSTSFTAVAATLPPPTRLAGSATRKLTSQVHAVAPKDSNLKLYHVMSVKQGGSRRMCISVFM